MVRSELARRRRQQGFTQEALAEKLGVAANTYQEWEAGVAQPRVGFRPRLARTLGFSLVELARILDGDDGAEPIAQGMAVPEWLGHLAALEQGAAAIATFQPMAVPALLQTEAYATAVERGNLEAVSTEGIAQRVAARLARQAVLDRFPQPLRLSVVLDESVLYRVAGDGEVMFDQLEHLLGRAALDTVDLRVLPFGTGDFNAAFGAFTLLTSPGGCEPYMACASDRVGPHYLDRRPEVEAHARLFRHLEHVALSTGESLDLIRATAKERFS